MSAVPRKRRRKSVLKSFGLTAKQSFVIHYNRPRIITPSIGNGGAFFGNSFVVKKRSVQKNNSSFCLSTTLDT